MILTLLKKRFFRNNKKPVLKYGTVGLYAIRPFRFEYKYKLFFRKFFKRSVKRRRRKAITCYRRKVWLFIRPNYVLSHKSKNARMGKGKGNFKRWCVIIHPGRVFIEHLNVSTKAYIYYRNKVQHKIKINLYILNKSLEFIKPKIRANKSKLKSRIIKVKRKKSLILFNRVFKKFLYTNLYSKFV